MKKKSAFTLIELIVVISIVALISTFVFFSLSGSKQKEKDAKKISEVTQIQTALENYKRAEGSYPESLTVGQPLVGSTTNITFLSKIPETEMNEGCGVDRYSYSYSTITKEYSLFFCIDNDLDNYVSGNYKATPKGIEYVKPWSCGDILVDFRDGQEYPTAQIGAQCWMTKNMNYDNGCASILWVNQVDVGWCGCYSNDSNNCVTRGKLYQWSAAMNGATTEGVQGICPSGWHIPTNSEQYVLYNYVNIQPQYRCNDGWYLIAKSLSSKSYWSTSAGLCAVGNNLGANNASGFNGIPGGYRNWYSGAFDNFNNYFIFLSSTKYNGNVIGASLSYSSDSFGNIIDAIPSASSIRCLKNQI